MLQCPACSCLPISARLLVLQNYHVLVFQSLLLCRPCLPYSPSVCGCSSLLPLCPVDRPAVINNILKFDQAHQPEMSHKNIDRLQKRGTAQTARPYYVDGMRTAQLAARARSVAAAAGCQLCCCRESSPGKDALSGGGGGGDGGGGGGDGTAGPTTSTCTFTPAPRKTETGADGTMTEGTV